MAIKNIVKNERLKVGDQVRIVVIDSSLFSAEEAELYGLHIGVTATVTTVYDDGWIGITVAKAKNVSLLDKCVKKVEVN